MSDLDLLNPSLRNVVSKWSKCELLLAVDGDPHFIIAVPQKEDALCFNIYEEPGKVLNLIRDPTTGKIFLLKNP